MKKLWPFLLLLASMAHGTPSITAVSGNISYGSSIVITGTGFGTKPIQDKTYFFANFEDASAGVAGTTWCVTTSMTNQSNVARGTTNCFEGSGCLTNAATMLGSNNNTASVSHPDVGAGGKLMCSFVWRLDGTPIGTFENLKTFRWWSSFSYNNWYMAQQRDDGFLGESVEVENGAGDTFDPATMHDYTNRMVPPPNRPEQMEMRIKENSAANATDGQIYVDRDQINELTRTNWQSNTAAAVASHGRYTLPFPVHMVWTGSAGGSGFHADNNMYYDDIIVDTSWCQVWFTTSSTNAAGGRKYWLAVQTWTNGTVIAVIPQKLTAGQQLYLYVRENGGTVNANGFPLTFNGSSGSPTPIVSSIAVSSSGVNGNVVTDLYGSNFVAVPTVVVGTVTLTGVTYLDSTHLLLNMIANSAGTKSITVSNPDGKSSVLASTFTFYAPPTVTGIDVSSGPILGGISNVVRGTFRSGFSVKFGTASASAATVYGSSITLTVPAFGAGTTSYTVIDNFGQSTVTPSSFTYYGAPAPTSITPTGGYTTGGDSFVINGPNFLSGDTVKFNATSATSGSISTTIINGTTPALSVGDYSVYVYDVWGQRGATPGTFAVTSPSAPKPAPLTAFPFITGH